MRSGLQASQRSALQRGVLTARAAGALAPLAPRLVLAAERQPSRASSEPSSPGVVEAAEAKSGAVVTTLATRENAVLRAAGTPSTSAPSVPPVLLPVPAEVINDFEHKLEVGGAQGKGPTVTVGICGSEVASLAFSETSLHAQLCPPSLALRGVLVGMKVAWKPGARLLLAWSRKGAVVAIASGAARHL
jgi:hypothetical protein